MADEPDRNDEGQHNSAPSSDPISPEDILSNLMNSLNGGNQLSTSVQAYAQEYEHLDKTMDEIDSFMNKLEQQNDTLNAELDELLESNRQARKELQQQNTEQKEENNKVDSS